MRELVISKYEAGQRFDKFLAKYMELAPKSFFYKMMRKKNITLNGKKAAGNEKLEEGDTVKLFLSEETIEGFREKKKRAVHTGAKLDILYEDDDILVINKPRDLVVHPGAGNPDGTVLNALLHYYPPIADVPRAGIVHRLDKDTTGLMVVAKTVPAQTRLVESLQLREITREYEAVAIGHMTAGGTVEEPISRHPTKRTHMSVHPMGKPAVTHYRIMEHFRIHTRLRLRLETGRTHQIRVHMAHITHPLVGDQVYGGRPRPPKGASDEFISVLRKFDRQALHATMLRLYHPITGIQMEWHAPLPQDMVELIDAMRADFEEHKDHVDWL